MDKNAIKKYAVWARRELISRVSQKALQYGISDTEIVAADAVSVNGRVLSSEEIRQRRGLIDQISRKGYEQAMEEAAYTWFNRFIALRFMEVNDYLPSRVRVFTDEHNAFKPEILAQAIDLELDGLDMDKVYAFKEANDDEGLFKYLVITQCNALSAVLPGMFQRISDDTELLFPDNLLRAGSAIEQMIAMIPKEDWTDQVQILGWLYQYYNSEKKDEVFAALKKNVKITKENIPAATQLFTPDWIVRYMVENSLGRLWVEGHPDAGLRESWKYYLDEAEQEPEVERQLAVIRKEYASLTPEQIKCIDPCAGSGHILAYLFDVLMQIYDSYGYTTREAVRSIVEHNLYGLDIDDRAAQLAYFTVMMKARQYDRRFLARKNADGEPDVPQPHVYPIVESNGIDRSALADFINGDTRLKKAMDSILKEMTDAKEYGSILNITPVDFDALYARFDEVHDEFSLTRSTILNTLLPLVRVAQMLSQKYDVVVTNPPYRGIGDVSPTLQDFTKTNYPDSYSDLSTVFMERSMLMSTPRGITAMINIPVWMSLAAYRDLRKKLLRSSRIVNMLHLGRGMFGSDFGTTAFVIEKGNVNGYTGYYKKFFQRQGSVESEEVKKQKFFGGTTDFYTQQVLFDRMPNSIISYSATESYVSAFSSGKTINTIATVFEGLKTRDKERFLRLWFEISNPKWKPYAKGGAYRKWYGNNDYVVNWGTNGDEVRAFKKSSGANFPHYFTPSITYTAMTMSKFTGRYIDSQIFGGGGGGITASNRIIYLLGLVNSTVFDHMISSMKSTVNFEVGQIGNIPVLNGDASAEKRIDTYVNENVHISREEWDSFEYSWDFKCHPLISVIAKNRLLFERGRIDLAECFACWEAECDDRFNKLKANEEELNRIFIDIYGLGDELSPEVDDKDVTVRKADLGRDIRSLISYAVGCMFGRYSLDCEGLAYAGGAFSEQWAVVGGQYYRKETVGRYVREELSRVMGLAEIDGSGLQGVSFPVGAGNTDFDLCSPEILDAIASGDCTKLVAGGWKDAERIDWEAIHCALTTNHFSPAADNIIPICDDDYFADDLLGRFVRFIETVYGSATLEENLRFIADALGGKGQPREVIRSYLLNDFYADHLKTYQKRPIYWLFDSGKKGGFKALIYMHRYAPDTIARLRTDYVHEQQSRYRTAIADLEQRIPTVSTSERVKLSKKLKKLQDQADELQSYEEKIHHLADQYIPIDLDDGVKKNYAIFGDVLAKIK